MKKIFTHIASFFYAPVPKEMLGIFRVLVSGFALLQLLVLLPDWGWLYGPKGLIPWEISDALSTNGAPSLRTVSSVFGLSQNITVYIITTIYFLSLGGLFIGYKTRYMAAVAWLMHLIINTTGNLTAYGVETFTHIALFYCMVLPVGVSLSLDARKKICRVPGYLITLSVRVIQLHLCIMYLACGIEKAMGEQWWNGEAIWIAMQQDQFHHFNINWMAHFTLIPKLLCWGTLLLETFYPVAIFFSKTKRLWLAGIISMHLFIAVFLGLHLFGLLMMLLNISAFGLPYYGASIKTILKRCKLSIQYIKTFTVIKRKSALYP